MPVSISYELEGYSILSEDRHLDVRVDKTGPFADSDAAGKEALNRLKAAAYEIGCNGIIRLRYYRFPDSITVSGLAVKVKKI